MSSKAIHENFVVGGELAFAVPKAQLWTGRVLTALAVLFLLFDAAGKLFVPPQVAEASMRLGISVSLDHLLGAVLLASTALYLIPRASVLGAAVLTGYLGGAVAVQIHAGSSLFETIFPILFAVLIWAGLVLRDAQVRALFPVRRKGRIA
jgi:hypothetical protein